jgi:hypothetical protein
LIFRLISSVAAPFFLPTPSLRQYRKSHTFLARAASTVQFNANKFIFCAIDHRPAKLSFAQPIS